MENQLNCPLCQEEIYSKVGIGCLMCGMPLEENNEDFCSKTCKKTFNEINNF